MSVSKTRAFVKCCFYYVSTVVFYDLNLFVLTIIVSIKILFHLTMDSEVADKGSLVKKCNSRYSPSEDKAIVNYMITDNRYLKSSGIQVWKDAEKAGICPGRPYLSMKERFRKVIVKNLKQYNVDKGIAVKITQFMRATQKGKRVIRYQQST